MNPPSTCSLFSPVAPSAPNQRAPRSALISALHDAAHTPDTFLRLLPTLGPLQMIEQYICRSYSPLGVVSSEPARLLRAFGADSPGEAQLRNPSGLTTTPDGNVVVADTRTQRLHVFEVASGAFVPAAFARDVVLRPSFPSVLAFSTRSGCLFVSDATPEGRVRAISLSNGSVTHQFRGMPVPLGLVGGLALDDCGHCFTAEPFRRSICEFAADGTFLRELSIDGATLGEPAGIAISPLDDSLIVVDRSLLSVVVLRRDGTVMRTFNSTDSVSGSFSLPDAVCVDADGNIVVGDSGRFRVQVFRADGTLIKSFGKSGRGPGEFRGNVGGVGVTLDGSIAVVDCFNKRVQVWR